MSSSPEPNLIDQTTLVSLSAVLIILFAALGLSRKVLAPSTPSSLRVLFVWHAFDALIHFFLEGSFLYHCFFSSIPIAQARSLSVFYPDPHNYLGYTDRVHGSQAAGDNPFAQLWMVYARADRRWAGVDLVSFAGVADGIVVKSDGMLTKRVLLVLGRRQSRAPHRPRRRSDVCLGVLRHREEEFPL
jgi:hypothetical protein